MRALETQRWIVGSTNTGITAVIDHNGQIQAQLETSVAGHLKAEAELRHGNTPYMLWQHYPLLLLSLAYLALISGYRRVSQGQYFYQFRGSNRG